MCPLLIVELTVTFDVALYDCNNSALN